MLLCDVSNNVTAGGLKLNESTLKKLERVMDLYVDDCVRNQFDSKNEGIKTVDLAYRILPLPDQQEKISNAMKIMACDARTSDVSFGKRDPRILSFHKVFAYVPEAVSLFQYPHSL